MFRKSHVGKFVLAMTLSMVVVGAAVVVHRLSQPRDQARSPSMPNSSTAATNNLTTLIPRTTRLTEQPNLTEDIEALLLRDRRLLRRNLTSSQETIVIDLPTNDKVKSAAYELSQNLVAYITEKDNVDALFLLRLTGETSLTFFKARHPFAEGEEGAVNNTYLSGRLAFVGQGKYLSVEESLWEGCNERIFDVGLANEIAIRFCGALNWSEDGSRLVEASTHGLVTSPYLALSHSGRPGDLQAVDFFSAEGGRGLFFDATTREMQRGFVGAHFVGPDELILITDQGSEQRPYALRYRPSTNSLTTIARLPDKGYFRSVVIGEWIILAGNEGVFALNTLTKEFAQFVADNFPEKPSSDYQLTAVDDHRVVVQPVVFSAAGVIERLPAFLIDPGAKQFARLEFPSEKLVELRRRDGGA